MNTNKVMKPGAWFRQLLPVLLFVAFAVTAQAAYPPAGSVIGNQATATYDDASGVSRTATSNLVETTIQQIADLTLLPLVNGVTSGAGAQVFFSHSITNDGNGVDFFTLTATDETVAGNDAFVGGSIYFYADANSDGIPDDLSNSITVTPNLAIGGAFNFLVGATISGTAAAGNESILEVTATSNFDNTVSDGPAVDTATVSNNAIIAITKAVTPNSGPSGAATEYTVTLRYTNSGNTGATSVIITDSLPTGMSYVADSGLWSATGATAMDDTDNAWEQTSGSTSIDYQSSGNVITIELNTVPTSATGEVTFKITIDSGVAPGNLFNVATVDYHDGVTPNIPGSSNTVPFTVTQNYDVIIADGTTVGSATQGSTITFTNTVTNNGNGDDTFNITLSDGPNPFWAGTSFVLYKSDNATPLNDTNGDGVPDTGILTGGGTYDVVVRVTLPPGATGGPYNETVTATSVGDNNQTDTATDELTLIAENVVDLTNDAAETLGNGDGPEGSAVATNSPVLPGATTNFSLWVNNESSVTDQFNLTVDSALPAGWSVVFRNTAGIVVTATDPIAASGQEEITAQVTVAADATPGAVSINFMALSPTSNAEDTIHDAVDVSEVRSIQIAPNNTGQVVSGGPVVYSHTITNTGNIDEGGLVSVIGLAAVNSDPAQFTSTIYYDDDGNGVFDGTEPAVSALPNTLTLAPGDSTTVFVRVLAALGTPDGAVNTTTLTAETTNGTYTSTLPAPVSAVDSTTVINGDVEILKEQALDAANDGTPDGAYILTGINANPGEGIRYKVTITNTGAVGVTNVVFNDTTPPFTTQHTGTNDRSATGLASWSTDGGTTFEAFDGAGGDVEPGDGSSGTITLNIGSLASGASATVYFGVKIDE